MKKFPFAILCALLILNIIEVRAITITSFTDFSNYQQSKQCTSNYCATDLKQAGLRISVVDGNGNQILSPKNFWSTASINESVNTKKILASAELDYPTSDYAKGDCKDNKRAMEIQSSLPNVYDFSFGIPSEGSWTAKSFIDNLSISNINAILKNLANSSNISQYYSYYLKIEPIYVIREYYLSRKKHYCSYYAGNTSEILNSFGKNDWSNSNYSVGAHYVSGGNEGPKGTISGPWNVVRNYTVSIYYDCDSKKNGGPNTYCWNFDYEPKEHRSQFESGIRYNNIPDLNNLYNQTGHNGLGTGYIKISDYAPTCESEFIEHANNKQERIKLYNKYSSKENNWNKYRNLLDFNNTTDAKKACSGSAPNLNNQSKCLEFSHANLTFDSNNISNYNETIDISGNKGYCLTTFDLVNKLETREFYSKKSSQLLKGKFKTANNEVLYRDVFSTTLGSPTPVMVGKLQKKCYVLSDRSSDMSLRYNDYIDGVYFYIEDADSESERQQSLIGLQPISEIEKSVNGVYNAELYEYDAIINVNYYLKPIFAKNITGQLSNKNCKDNTCKFLGYGLVSKFIDDDTSVNIPFKIDFNKDKQTLFGGDVSIKSGSKSCSYTSSPELVCTDNCDNIESKLNLEFRVIDTKNPFPGKNGNGRNVGRNWCSGFETSNDEEFYDMCAKRILEIASGSIQLNSEESNLFDVNADGKISAVDSRFFLGYKEGSRILEGEALNKVNQLKTYYSLNCLVSNPVITENIINSTDSYGYNKSTNTYNNKPMYHIVLDSKTIDSIREYNKENPYNNYDMKCDRDGKNCTSNFLDNSKIWNSKNLIQR